MSKLPVSRPFGEPDLRDEVGANPMDAAGRRPAANERGSHALSGREAGGEAL